MAVTYQALDVDTQRTLITQRLAQLEQQYFQLNLRATAPSPADNVTQTDKDQLAELDTSIGVLDAMLAALTPPATPAPTT